jgi:hypothetical protein
MRIRKRIKLKGRVQIRIRINVIKAGSGTASMFVTLVKNLTSQCASWPELSGA